MTKSEQHANAPLPARQGDTRPLLERVLSTPDLPRLVPRLPPEVLHRVIEQVGLEDCSEVVALATPQQLSHVFDIDLWRPDKPGLDETFDADRFGLWLGVLAEHDPAVAAGKLAGMDTDLLITAFAQHLRVYDPAVLRIENEDGEPLEVIHIPDEAPTSEVGGYLIVGSRDDAWDALVDVLVALEAEHSKVFHSVMRGCRGLSNADREIDGLDDLAADPEQAMFDLALDREERRGEQGYMSPAQARAFLQAARELDIAHSPMPDVSPIALAYFRMVAAVESDAVQTDEPQAGDASDDSPAPTGSAMEHAGEGPTDHLAELLVTLREAGVVPQAPRALLGKPAGGAGRLERIRAAMQGARERDELAYLQRGEELAYLANTLMSGSSIQGRPMTAQEASDAAVAVCNLGLEHWPSRWSVRTTDDVATAGSDDGEKVPDDFLVSCDLIRVFQVGWSVQYRQVCAAAAERLLEALASLAPGDSELKEGIETLRGELSQGLREGRPWRARDAIDVIAGLDMLTWYGLLGLIDECPVLHAAVRATQGRRLLRVSPTDFEFIATNEQIACAAAFMRALPATLGAI